MTPTEELAASLNECLPIDGLVRAEVCGLGMLWLCNEWNAKFCVSEEAVIGYLWRECVRRGWYVELSLSTVKVSTVVNGRFDMHFQVAGTSALSFARAFAAAKKAAEGGAK